VLSELISRTECVKSGKRGLKWGNTWAKKWATQSGDVTSSISE
jgi:hypothetical protein